MAHLSPGWGQREIDVDPDETGEDAAFELEGGVPGWERRLNSSEKLRRGILPVLALVAVVFVMAGGPASLGAWLSSTPPAVSAAPLHVAGTQPWRIMNGPLEALANPNVSISPANGPLGLAYACWSDKPQSIVDTLPAPLHVATYAPSAGDWRDGAPPVAQAVRCIEVPDQTRQEQVLAEIWDTSPDDADCQTPALYHSADRGATWSAVTWPAGMPVECTPGLALIDGRIYAFGHLPLLPSDAMPADAAGRFITTADLGRSWQAADVGFQNASGFLALGFRPGGRILAQAMPAFPADQTLLWESGDSGASWHSLGALPGASPRVFVSGDPADTDHGGWGRLYLQIAPSDGPGSLENGALSTGYPSAAWAPLPLASDPAEVRWHALPLPPGADSTVGERPWGFSFRSASLGSGDGLLYIRPLQNTSPYIIIPQFEIMSWDVSGGAWVRVRYTVPPNATIQGAAWNGGRLTIWLTLYGGGLTARVRVYTATL